MSLSDRSIGQFLPVGFARGSSAVILLVSLAAAIPIFWTPLQHTWQIWMTSPEYNYGPIIPIIAGVMLWRDLRRSTVAPDSGRIGLGIVLFALICGVLGQIAAFVFLAQIGSFLFVVGLFTAFVGDRRALSAWPGLFYLGFAIPLAKMLQASLSAKLQLISSELGVLFIRIFNVPVFLEGNVIDLGSVQLQVVEACSGLRYLFPLASFSFLCAYLIQSPRWQRVVIFLSALPITIVLNSARIAITGILADNFGIGAATGFFHDFEGWLVFCACIAVLFLEMKLLCYAGGSERSLLKRLDFSFPPRRTLHNEGGAGQRITSGIVPGAAAAATLLALVILLSVDTTETVIPARQTFAAFPRQVGPWQTIETSVDSEALEILKATDYLSVNFSTAAAVAPVNLWIAYYESQEIGEAIHSPQICIPGGGWQITNMSTVPLGTGSGGAVANRAIIEKNGSQQLVYYWFQGRGRTEASEYTAKLTLMADALLRNRTDGALVRLVAPIDPKAGVAPAEATLKSVVAQLQPVLGQYLPE